MAILKMDKIRILGLKNEKSNVLSFLQRKGIIELIDLKISDLKENDASDVQVSAEDIDLQENIQKMQNDQTSLISGIHILDEKFPGKTIEKKNFNLSLNEFLNIESREEEIIELVNNVLKMENNLSSLQSELTTLNKEQQILKNWLNVPLNPAKNTTERTKFFLGTLNKNDFLHLKETISAEENLIAIVPLNEDDDLIQIAVVGFKEDELEIDHLLKQNGFKYYPFAEAGKPRELYNNTKETINKKEVLIEETLNSLEKIADKRLDFYILYDYYNIMIEQSQALELTKSTMATFLVEGYLPQKISNNIKNELENEFTVFVE
ncbi:MAG: hypothetical protein GX326_05195, partial [Clostridiaceae bacterium]|nr:hypothetical protein [Clostridiaceae bacterium]